MTIILWPQNPNLHTGKQNIYRTFQIIPYFFSPQCLLFSSDTDTVPLPSDTWNNVRMFTNFHRKHIATENHINVKSVQLIELHAFACDFVCLYLSESLDLLKYNIQ